jgi:hypothetical protein
MTMSSTAHAKHAPPKPGEPLHGGPPLSFGTLYPEGDVHAVIDDRDQAERAVQALRAAGIPEGDIDLVEGPWYAELHRNFLQHRSLLQHAESVIASLVSDHAKHFDEYAEEARKGHNILIVHATEPEVLEKVRQVLVDYDARLGRHYGHWTVTYLC